MAYLMISDKIPTVNDNHTATQSITRASHYRTGFGTSEWRYSSWHKHLYAQLLYPAEGVVRVWAGESVWLVHASSALWLPPQMPHKFVATGNVLLKTVLVSEAESETLGKVCFMTGISPLLKGITSTINQLPPSQSTTDKQQLRFSALETLILQEIKMG